MATYAQNVNINGEAAVQKTKEVASKASRVAQDQINGARSHISDYTKTAKETTLPQARAAATSAATTAQRSASKAVGTTVGAARATVNAGLSATRAATSLTLGGAAKAVRFYVQTTANVVGAGVGAASAVTGYAYGTAGSLASKAVDTGKAAATFTVVTTHNTAKRVLPVSVVGRAEQSYQAVAAAAADPIEVAKNILPKPISGALEWSVNTAVNTKDYTVCAVSSTKEMIVGTAVGTVNNVVSTLDAADKRYMNDASNAWAEVTSTFPSQKATTA